MKINNAGVERIITAVTRIEPASPRRALLLVAAAVLAPHAVLATPGQTAPPDGAARAIQLQEIIVTATKRAEPIDRVPISILAYTQHTMDMQGIKNFRDIARVSPSVTLVPTMESNTSASNVAIRGISSNAGAATVGVYINDAPVQIFPDSLSSVNPYPVVFDLKRVEILRGPQGTLFGAGSEGGTIRFITPSPGLTHYSSYVRTDLSSTAGGDPSYELGAGGGGPIIKHRLGFRASAYYRRGGGYVDRVNWVTGHAVDRNSNWNDVSALSLALRWKPLRTLSMTASIFYQNRRINDSSIYWEELSNPGQDVFRNANQIATPTDDRWSLPAIHVAWRLGGAELIENASYLDRQNANIYDDSSLSLAVFAGFGPRLLPQALQSYNTPGYLNDTQSVFTQELRLQSTDSNARLRWVIGSFYQHSHQDAANNIQDPYLNQALTYLHVPFQVSFYQNLWFLYAVSNLTDVEKAVYGNVAFKVLPKLTLSAGARISRHQYRIAQFSAGPVVGTNTGIASTSSQTDTPVTPRFVASYQMNPRNMFYVSAAKGFREGSTAGASPVNCEPDLAAIGLTTAPRVIRPDYVWSYEVGAKNRLLDNHLQLATSVYRIDWHDIQSGFTLPVCNVPITANLGNAVSKGVDEQASLLVSDNLLVSAAVSYDDAKFTTTTEGAGGKVIRSAGQPLNNVAPWKISASAQYNFNAFGHESYLTVDDQYTSHNNAPLDLASAATDPTIPRPPAYNYLSARLGMDVGHWNISIYGDNLGNAHPELGRYRDTPTTFLYRGLTLRPRTIGVTAIYRYR